MGVHDQRFKAQCLQEFLPDFLRLFFPEQAAALDFGGLEWLQQEVLTDPPAGDVYLLDLVARVRSLLPGYAPSLAATLVLLEVESREAVTETRAWLYHYYEALRRRHGLPVLPVALYLRVGLDGVGIDSYVETYGELEVLRFNYYYVGLPALEAEQYLTGDSWIGVALAALMRVAAERRAWLRAEALRRVYQECGESDYRRLLLAECVEAYLSLDPQQQVQYEQLLHTERYQAMLPTMMTTFEKGVQQGMQQGMQQGAAQGKREGVRLLLEKRFGPLGEAVRRQLDEWPADRLNELLLAAVDVPTLAALGLEG